MNNPGKIEELIKFGEGQNLEFKSNFNNELIESLVAFANTNGGKIIIGINQNSELTGVLVNSESIQNWINEIKQKTSPSIIPDVEIVPFKDKILVIFSVQEYPIKPVATRGKYFKRVANSNHLMQPEEIANEHLHTLNTSWDFYPDINHGIDSISLEKVKKFIYKFEQQKNTTIDYDPLGFLTKFEIIRNQQLTFGGYLLFADNYCSISDIQAGRFKSESMIIDSISLNTDLFSEVDEIIAFIRKHLMVEYIITGEPRRTERFDYPTDAIREIVINMIVHRDYHDNGHSIIKIFDDRIEFFNPGKLFGNLTIKQLLSDNYISQPRNKLIAKAFKEAGLIERYGSGIKRILNICKNYGIKQPVFEEVFNGFRVILFKEKLDVPKDVVKNVAKDVAKDVTKENRLKNILIQIKENQDITIGELSKNFGVSMRTINRDIEILRSRKLLKRVVDKQKVTNKVTNRVTDKVTDNQKAIISHILENKSISTSELSDKIGISLRKIKENIGKLKEGGILRRVGSAKGGHWEILQ